MERLDIGRDVAAVEPERRQESADRIAPQIVVAGDGEHRRRDGVEEAPRHRELGMAAALREIARSNHEIRVLRRKVGGEAGGGDRIVVTAPVWPNVVEIPRILSARMQTVALERAQGRWRISA